jgi:hypothetical protein
MEHDKGRIVVKFSMEVTGRRAIPAQRLMMAYARSLEALLVERRPVKTAAKGADTAERGIRGAERSARLMKCVAVVALLAGAGVAVVFATNRIHPAKESATPAIQQAAAPALPRPSDPRIQISSKPADPSAPKKKTAPVITVRRSGEKPQAAAKSPD